MQVSAWRQLLNLMSRLSQGSLLSSYLSMMSCLVADTAQGLQHEASIARQGEGHASWQGMFFGLQQQQPWSSRYDWQQLYLVSVMRSAFLRITYCVQHGSTQPARQQRGSLQHERVMAT